MNRSVSVARNCAASLLLIAGSAWGVQTSYSFNASLDTGPLQGVRFPGTFSFDSAAETGVGQEYLSLTTFDFTLLGTRFTRDDIRQGGQVIVNNGAVSYFTAALFPLAPAPVNDIAFGFGGPGIIGYSVSESDFIGLGSYTFQISPVPEPAVALLIAGGLLALGMTKSKHAGAKRAGAWSVS